MTEKITRLVQELQDKNEELEVEIKGLSKQNLSLLDNIKKKFKWGVV